MIKKGDIVETVLGTKGEVVDISGWKDNKPYAIKIKTADTMYPHITVFVSNLKQ